MIVITDIAREFLVIHVIDDVDDAVEERNVMGNEDKCVLVFLQISLEPGDVLFVEVVGRLVKEQDLRLLKKELAQEHFGALAAGELCDIPVQAQIHKPERAGNFRDLRIDGVKIVRIQKLLQCAGLLHISHHFFFCAVRHQTIQLVAALLHLVEVVKRARKDTFNCHAGCEMSMLIEISGSHMPGPLDRPFIRLQLSCDNAHEGGFSLAVRADKADMFSLQKPERHVFKDRPIAKSMC